MKDLSASRRALLVRMAAGGMLAGGLGGWMSRALASGDMPAKPGLHRLEGTATINGVAAKAGTPVRMGDRIATGPGSQAIVVTQGDAFLLRGQSTIQVQGKSDGLVVSEVLVSSGKVLSVFAKKPLTIKAMDASIGIRGTGAYLEVERNEVYFCLCYGEALVEGPGMQGRVVKTKHHEEPLLLLRNEGGAYRAEPGPFRNHTDAELTLLEGLLGRQPPFVKEANYPSRRY